MISAGTGVRARNRYARRARAVGVPVPRRRARLEASPARRLRQRAGRAGGARAGARAAAARANGIGETLTLAELVDEYLAQHEAEPETLEKLRWLLAQGGRGLRWRRLGELRPQEIAAWRMTIPPGHRFEATQALRQVLARAVVWGMLDVNPAKQGVENPQRRRTEKRPFESWARTRRGRRAARAALRADGDLRGRDRAAARRVDRARAARHRPRGAGRLRPPRLQQTAGSSAPKTEASIRAVPLQAIALAALDQLPRAMRERSCCSRPRAAATSTCTTSATATGSPPSSRPGSSRCAAIYDLRHTFATFALRAGISTFDLSRYMGASLTMIDRHYGHLARDGREHAIRLLDSYADTTPPTCTLVDARWTPNSAPSSPIRQRKQRLSRRKAKAL